MSRLSETNYITRRIKLQANIDAAKRAHEDAAFRQELGELDGAGVKIARDAVTELEERLVGLEAAWARTKQDMEAEYVAARADARRSAVAAVEDRLKTRALAVRQMAKLAAQLGEVWKQFEAANASIVEATAAVASDLGGEGRKNLRHLLEGDYNSVKPSLGGELADAGLILTSNDFTARSWRVPGREDGLVAFTERRNSMIRSALDPLLEEA